MSDFFGGNDNRRDDTGGGFIGELFGGGKKKKGDDGMGILVGIFIFLFVFGPILFAKFVGWVWGMLLKLGFVGRIITTVLMLIVGPMILTFPLLMLASMGGGGASGFLGSIITIVMAVFMVGAALIPAAWYYIWHYDAVKLMGPSVFSEKIKKFAMFFWFGFIGSGLISMASPGVGGFLALAVSAAGFIYYFKATSEYRREAKENPSIQFTTATKSIIMIVVLGLMALTGVLATVSEVAKGVKNRIEAAQLAAAAGKYTAGMTVTVTEGYSNGEAPITDKAMPLSYSKSDGTASAAVKNVKVGTTLTVTGKAEKEVYDYWCVPVEHEGDRGYIRMEYISPAGGN